MANARTTTTLEVKVNAREVADLDRRLKRTFNGASVRGFQQAVGQVNKALEANRKHTDKILEGMQKVKRGSTAWKRLSQDLREVNREAKALDQAMDRLQRSQARVGTSGRGAGGGGGFGGAGGGAGVAGVRGMQLAMPGAGSIATSLGAIPLFGAVGAGSFLAAQQSYGSLLSYQRSRMQAAPFLMGTADAMSFRRRMVSGPTEGRFEGPAGVPEMSPQEVREEAIKRLTPGMGAMVAKQTVGRVAALADAITGGNLEQRVSDRADLVAKERAERFESGTQTMRDEVASRMIGGLAGFTEIFGGNESMQRTYAKTLGRKFIPGRGARFNRAFGADAFRQEGMQFGVSPAEALQQASQLAQAAGAPVAAQEFGAALSLQRTTGVGLQQQGAMVKAMRHAGHMDTGAAFQGMADQIGAAVAMGLEGSEIGHELQKQTQFLQQQAERGITLDPMAFTAMQMGMTNRGIAGFRAGDITRSFAQGGAEAGFRGPQSATDLRLMRAMGFTGRGGPEEYAKFRLQMQDPSQVIQALPQYLQQFQTAGMGDNLRTLMAQQAMNKFGARIGPGEAQKLMELMDSGAFDGGVDLDALRSAGIDLTKATGGALRAEAGIEAERIGTGGRVAGDMQRLSRVTNDMAASFMNMGGPVLELLTQNMETFTGALERATRTLLGTAGGAATAPMNPRG